MILQKSTYALWLAVLCLACLKQEAFEAPEDIDQDNPSDQIKKDTKIFLQEFEKCIALSTPQLVSIQQTQKKDHYYITINRIGKEKCVLYVKKINDKTEGNTAYPVFQLQPDPGLVNKLPTTKICVWQHGELLTKLPASSQNSKSKKLTRSVALFSKNYFNDRKPLNKRTKQDERINLATHTYHGVGKRITARGTTYPIVTPVPKHRALPISSFYTKG